MNAGDLVVLYSYIQSERGIYAYVSGAWIKQTTPTQDQIMRCMVGVLDAVRSGYGQSAHYIGTGATSFETLLVNFIYAQYAMITGSIRAGTRYDQSGNETNPTQEGVWIGSNGTIKGAINDVEPDQITPSFTRRQLFTSSGTWAVPAHIKWVRVTAMGGGGGGGGSGGATDGGSLSASTVYNGNNGSAGGASSFGSYVIANGGAGGSGSGSGGAGASGQNGGSTDWIGGYNGTSGSSGDASGKIYTNITSFSSGAGGTRGSSVGLYDNVVEYSNVSGGMTKTPTISGGASKSNSVSSTSVRVVSHGSAGNPGGFGGGGGGAVAGAFAFKGGGGDQSYSARGGSGGGGGAGALRQRVFRISEVYGQGITVTVGAGGAGGSAGGGTTALGATGGKGGDGWVLVEW